MREGSLRRFLREEHGATMVEYAVMLALIAAVCFAVITILGQKTNNNFQPVTSGF
ncbi:MAG: Flp family type IVb pilin [Gemmatimonadota bacterium]